MRLDPNGETDYKLKRNGKIKKIKGTETEDGPDRLIAGKAKYSKSGELKTDQDKVHTVRKGIIKESDKKRIGDFVNEEGKTVKYTYNEMGTTGSRDELESLFNFVADNSNVEWTLNSITKNGTTFNSLTTSYFPDFSPRGGQIALNHARNLVYHIHSHPYQSWNSYGETVAEVTPRASGPDKKFMSRILMKQTDRENKAIFKIRFKRKNYDF